MLLLNYLFCNGILANICLSKRLTSPIILAGSDHENTHLFSKGFGTDGPILHGKGTKLLVGKMVARDQRQWVFKILPAEHRTGLKSYWIGRGVRTHFAQQRDNMISRFSPIILK